MARSLLIGCVTALAIGLGGCTSSYNPITQAKLTNQDDDVCQSDSGAPTGLAALSSPQSTYAACMQERYDNHQMGFSGGGRPGPSSQSSSLFNTGQ